METDVFPRKMEIMPPGTPTSFPGDEVQQEPPMHLHRPSSDRAQDVSHILTSLFEDLYTRDVMSKDTVDNLTSSGEGSTPFHQKCMRELSTVQEKHKKILEEYNKLERHIIQARARGASADERAFKKIVKPFSEEDCEKLGLPPVDSHFRWCLDEDMLKKHKLIIPSDLFSKTKSLLDRPKKNPVPHFSLPTISSSFHFLRENVDDGYHDYSELPRSPSPCLDDDRSVTTLSSDSADRISVPPQHRIKSVEVEIKKKERWRDDMKVDDRIRDREYLARLEERHNYLKNPRYLSVNDPMSARLLTKLTSKKFILKAGRSVAQELGHGDDIQVFEAFPKVVLFSDWTVGRVYETVLDLRNVSAVSRMMRVHPPRTSHFSLGLGKYPGQDSLVAPGICSSFNVRFMPDSLADYEDEIQVFSQVCSPLVVKIRARREPPVLTIPEKVQCGSCLVGGVKMIELPIQNLGGTGMFCILKRSLWPAANFKTVVNPACLDIGAFQFRPSVFEIPSGRSVSLELLFSPEETKKYSEDLVIVCDNCQVVRFSIHGEGERAGIELVSVSDGGEEDHKIGEIADLTANHLVTFPSLNPHSFYMRQIIIHNSAKVELPFSWHILKPNLIGASDQLMSDAEVDWETLEFCPEESSCFFIEPMHGVLQPDGIHEFVLTFAPHQVDVYRNVLHLVLRDVPDSKNDPKNQLTVGKTPSGVNMVEKLKQESRNSSASKLSRSGSMTQSVPSAPILKKVISLEIEISGECVPYAIMLHPLAVVITGNVLVGTTVRRLVQMANYSLAPVQFDWTSETSPNIIEVKPPMGVVGPGEIVDLEVTVTGLCVGPLECDLQCKLEHQETPLKLSVVANIDGPSVEIDNLMLDFGLLRLGESASDELFIRNTTQLNAHWSLHVDKSESSDFDISPRCGELTSLGQQSVKVTYKPTSCRTLHTSFYVDVEDGHGSSVAVHGEVQTQQACFTDCMMVLKDVFLSVPKPSKAVLVNQTSFPTAFEFQPIRGNQECDVAVHTPTGVLGPREEREIEIVFTSHTSGEVADVYLPCKIEGMDLPIVLGFYADVQILSVRFTTPDHKGPGLKVVFDDPKVGVTTSSRVLFTNLTAIRTPWSASVDYFKTSNRLPKPPSYDFKSMKTRRALLGRTPNLADPLAKTQSQTKADLEASILSDGRGAVFALNPSRGFLEPYQSQEVTVVAYNNMWGTYRDELTLSVEGYQTQYIPVELNVAGCPLAFQMSRDKDKTAVVRFGSHLEGGTTVVRNLRINNPCCCDIRLDWRNYNYPAPNDKTLVDLNLWFGEPFPMNKSRDRTRPTRDLHPGNQPAEDGGKPLTSPLVNVKIEPHLGVRSKIPFRMDPEQVVIPAHGHVVVRSIFKPLLLQCSDDEGMEYSSYALGFMSLDDESLKFKSDKLSRADGFSVDPLRIELTSYVRAGKVNVETPDDEDVTSFHLPLSDLLVKGNLLSSVKQEQVLTLINPTEAVLNFVTTVNPPFYLKIEGSSLKHSSLPIIRLHAQSNVKIKVGFLLDGEVVKALGALRGGRTLDGVRLKKEDVFDNETVCYDSNIRIRYSNGITQQHPLVASVSCPSFKTSVGSLSFETSFIGQEVHHLVTIVNQSGADTRWRARVEDVSNPEVGRFMVEPSEGTLEAFTNHRAVTKGTVAIFYQSKDKGPCSASVVFEGCLSEPIRIVKLQANGSFDGKFELK